MKTEINYTPDWHIDCPETEAEWKIFVKIMEHFGVAVYNEEYDPTWSYVHCSSEGTHIGRSRTELNTRKVTLLEAITLLQRPIKTEKQRKIEELEATIAEALKQVEELKGHEK